MDKAELMKLFREHMIDDEHNKMERERLMYSILVQICEQLETITENTKKAKKGRPANAPLYEYQCEECGSFLEVLQKSSDPPPFCDVCGKTKGQ